MTNASMIVINVTDAHRKHLSKTVLPLTKPCLLIEKLFEVYYKTITLTLYASYFKPIVYDRSNELYWTFYLILSKSCSFFLLLSTCLGHRRRHQV